MNVALRQPLMTRDQFLYWVQTQEGRYEFDGLQPVAMPGSTVNHDRICRNIWVALHGRLRGTRCEVLGVMAGLATVGDAVRYPDALVTCAKFPGSALLVPGVVVVFEVPNPVFDRTERIEKLLEYRAVSSIRRYVILECSSIGLTTFSRLNGTADWTANVFIANEALDMPELGIAVPVREFYENVDFSDTSPAAGA